MAFGITLPWSKPASTPIGTAYTATKNTSDSAVVSGDDPTSTVRELQAVGDSVATAASLPEGLRLGRAAAGVANGQAHVLVESKNGANQLEIKPVAARFGEDGKASAFTFEPRRVTTDEDYGTFITNTSVKFAIDSGVKALVTPTAWVDAASGEVRPFEG